MFQKTIRFLCGIFIVAVLLGTVVLADISDDTIGFETVSIPAEDKEVFLEAVNLQLIQDDSWKISIHSFDVSDKGVVAIGLGAGANSTVYVYDQANVFLFGYRFHSVGDYFVAFQEEHLAVYFVRADTIILLDNAGNCIDVQKVQNPNQASSHERFEELYYRTTKNHADNNYALERDIAFGNTYSRLVVTDEAGTRSVLYDVTTQHNVGVIAKYSLILGFFAIVVLIAYMKKRFAGSHPKADG